MAKLYVKHQSELEAQHHQADLLVAFKACMSSLNTDPQSIRIKLLQSSTHGDGVNLVNQRALNCVTTTSFSHHNGRKWNTMPQKAH